MRVRRGLLVLAGLLLLAGCIRAPTPQPPVTVTAAWHPTRTPNRALTSLAVAPDGTIWYSFDPFDGLGGASIYDPLTGLYRFRDGELAHFEIGDTIRDLLAVDDLLYVAAGCGVLRRQGERWQTLAPVDCEQAAFAEFVAPFELALAENGNLWVGGVVGLAHYDGVRWREYDVNVRRLLLADDDTVWGQGWDGRAGSDCCFVHVAGNTVVTYPHAVDLPVSPELQAEIEGLLAR